MKKIMGILAGLLGLGTIIVTGVCKAAGHGKAAASYSIIGGADGPTSIFVAGKIGNGFIVGGIAVGVLLLVVSGILLFKRKE